ncbi:MAG: phage tail tape measure protein [Cognatishimia sp.]
MTDFENIDTLGSQLENLDTQAGDAAQMVAAFSGEMQKVRLGLQTTGGDLQTLEKGLRKGLRKAVDGVVQEGDSLSEALRNVVSGVINAAYGAAVKPVTDHFGSLLARGIGGIFGGLLPFENGASFSQGRVMPFANGGIVSGPTSFPMRGGLGLMGEAGPEAIMPLARGADGKLGVRSAGGRPVQVVMNIQTPDVQSFQRSRGQIAAQMGRALAKGQRNR